MYDTVNISELVRHILSQARDDMEYAREALTEYGRSIDRETYSEYSRSEPMGGIAYYQATCSLHTLAELCRQLDKVGYLERISKILERHCTRLERDFTALYELERARIMAAVKAAHEARRH